MTGKPQSSYFPKAGINHGGSHPFSLGVGSSTLTLTLWFRREEAACFGMEGADAPRRALLGRVQGLLSGPPPPSLEQSALGRSWQRAKAKAEPLVSEELCPPLSCCRAGPPPPPPGGQAVGAPPVSRAVPPPPSLPAPLGPGPPCLRAYPPRSPTPGGARPAGHGPRLRAVVRLAAKGLQSIPD